MKPAPVQRPRIAIACGGTGGHLFPGLAVGEQLLQRGCEVTLIVSPKEVDQQAVQSVRGMAVVTLPAVGLVRGQVGPFLAGFLRSYRAARQLFRREPPQAVLAMGGFTSAPPILAGRAAGAATFLHESNTIPGKANRWLAHVVTQAFVGFPGAARHLRHSDVVHTGTPVRPQFRPGDAPSHRMALGLDPGRPVLLVTGGSQGASGVNDLVVAALPALAAALPDLQYLHLTGPAEVDKVRAAYAAQGLRAVVRPFLSEMELALGAATAAVSRAGASSLAELAVMRLPAVLIPYPAAADNHQWHNARALADAGAACVLEQRGADGPQLAALVRRLVADAEARAAMAGALAAWDVPDAAARIADRIVRAVEALGGGRWQPSSPASSPETGTLRLSAQAAPVGAGS
ncbi:MAG: UDP-N-acetylglucosamine--N-acetylmuramyl-(pentapeptide) pyrophosphoryl-undecaprenol [Verrucomicrobiota bacterium]